MPEFWLCLLALPPIEGFEDKRCIVSQAKLINRIYFKGKNDSENAYEFIIEFI